MSNRNVFSAIAKGKCPKCRSGDMFIYHPYSLLKGKFIMMHNRCKVCTYKYDMEPGFFIGASYVNYAFFIVILLSTYFSGRLFFDSVDSVVIFYVVLGWVLLLFPLLFRYSRIVYSYLFSGVRYDATLSDK
jgi:hypothetical protein